MSDSTSAMAEFLNDHPRLLGALFTLGVLATQAQPVLAQSGGTVDGP